ncbi:hypothetical protein [Terricaulis sp.]|uniref:hypothetical protein n=1 Tax=Terricaulis sp. TaxID=2768686 RepID=UPI0037830416
MSRQINFFLAEEDEAPFEAMLRESGPFIAFPDVWQSPVPDVEPTIRIRKMGAEAMLVLLTLKHMGQEVGARRTPGKLSYIVDTRRSPVIEFTRCFRGDTFIRRGRLYYSPTYYDEDGQSQRKSEDFVRWAEDVLVRTRRWLRRVDDHTYAGPAAQNAAARGVELKQF